MELLGISGGETYLAWQLYISDPEGHRTLFIDANSGEIEQIR